MCCFVFFVVVFVFVGCNNNMLIDMGLGFGNDGGIDVNMMFMVDSGIDIGLIVMVDGGYDMGLSMVDVNVDVNMVDVGCIGVELIVYNYFVWCGVVVNGGMSLMVDM